MTQQNQRRLWSDNELIQTLKLYHSLKANRECMSASNAKIVELAKALGRTAASIALRMANYKYLDGDVTGLCNTGASAARVWKEYSIN